ncbi:MAG: hypothetical protein KAR44_08200 [Candidatus Aegiribacteria sp.]|nr:hypothetical protein [Candidatus Aegiribacteria sp.]
MFHLRNYVLTILFVLLPTLISCSWSAKQQNILDRYSETAESINRNEWESAAAELSSSTMLLLDSLASDLQTRGLHGFRYGVDLLPILCREYIDFSGDVTMIFVQGDRADITLSSGEFRKYSMVFEGGYWKLNLEELFRSSIDAALTGSYVQSLFVTNSL